MTSGMGSAGVRFKRMMTRMRMITRVTDRPIKSLTIGRRLAEGVGVGEDGETGTGSGMGVPGGVVVGCWLSYI